MGRSHKFAIIRFAPADIRGERLNIGVVVATENALKIRLTRRLERVKAISSAIDIQSLQEIASNIEQSDAELRASGKFSLGDRLDRLSRIGPIEFTQWGSFTTSLPNDYESRLNSILQRYVEPEPPIFKRKEKRTRLLSEIKKYFRSEKVMATRDEGLESHRIVPKFEIADGLVADLVLKNGHYHVVETVDASSDDQSFSKMIAEIAVSALVLERARMNFGDSNTKSRLIYSASLHLEKTARPSLDAAAHQGTELINWASESDRNKFIHLFTSMATPIQTKKSKRRVIVNMSGDFFH